MNLLGITPIMKAPHLDESMGQFYIEELDLTTPLAPQPDRILDGVKYWGA